mgnify:CR=1 FL=1
MHCRRRQSVLGPPSCGDAGVERVFDLPDVRHQVGDVVTELRGLVAAGENEFQVRGRVVDERQQVADPLGVPDEGDPERARELLAEAGARVEAS